MLRPSVRFKQQKKLCVIRRVMKGQLNKQQPNTRANRKDGLLLFTAAITITMGWSVICHAQPGEFGGEGSGTCFNPACN
jgi:hypothetical protein